jgi:hypothetical protein
MNIDKVLWALQLGLSLVESAAVVRRFSPDTGVRDLQPCVFWRPQSKLFTLQPLSCHVDDSYLLAALIRDKIYVDGGLREGFIQPTGEWNGKYFTSVDLYLLIFL